MLASYFFDRMSFEDISSQLNTLTTEQLWELHTLIINKLRPAKKAKKTPWFDEVKAVLEDMRKTNPQAKYKDAMTEASIRRKKNQIQEKIENPVESDSDNDTFSIDSALS